MLQKPEFNKQAREILVDRYLWKDDSGNPCETPEQMLMRVANHVASAEKTAPQRFAMQSRSHRVLKAVTT